MLLSWPWCDKCGRKRNHETKNNGESHPDTLRSLNNLALFYDNQGKYDLAEQLYKECQEKQKLVLGDSHPHPFLNLQLGWSLF
jgi:hypothetical protein